MVHVLAGRLPIEIDRAQHLHRDRFDIGEELGEPLLGAFPDRRQAERAIAENDGRRTVLGREGAQRVPGDLGVVMAMVVDKARGDGAAVGVDRLFGRARQFADFDDLAALDADIAAKRRHARAIDDAAVFDQEVIGHRCYSSFGRAARRRPLVTSRECSVSVRRDNAGAARLVRRSHARSADVLPVNAPMKKSSNWKRNSLSRRKPGSAHPPIGIFQHSQCSTNSASAELVERWTPACAGEAVKIARLGSSHAQTR